MKQLNLTVGKKGEEKAAEYLLKNGFCLVEKNFRTRFGEIDLIATKGKRIHFIEVKLKVGEDFGLPEEMINRKKIQKVQNIATLFLQKNQLLAQRYPVWEIDAVCIVLDENGSIKRMSFYENVEL
jgi:putative endonuclease